MGPNTARLILCQQDFRFWDRLKKPEQKLWSIAGTLLRPGKPRRLAMLDEHSESIVARDPAKHAQGLLKIAEDVRQDGSLSHPATPSGGGADPLPRERSQPLCPPPGSTRYLGPTGCAGSPDGPSPAPS